MGIEIGRVQYYQTELRIADRKTAPNDKHAGNETIDTPAEAEAALENILNGLDISKAPKEYQLVLRKQVDRKDGLPNGFNDRIDKDEVALAKKALLEGRTRYEVLANFVYFNPEAPEPCSCEYPGSILPVSSASKAKNKNGKYARSAAKLAEFFLKSDGNPPNATKSFKVNGEEAIGAYHVYEDDKTHIENGGATTSEGQVLFFNFMVLYAALSGDRRGMDGAYNYIKHFLMPHDGEESVQLPDHALAVKDERWNPYLMHWLIDISGKSGAGGDATFGENVTYEVYQNNEKGQRYSSPRVAQMDNDLDPELGFKTIASVHTYMPGQEKHTFRFGAALDADQWFQEGLFWANYFGLKDYSHDIKCFKKSLVRGLTGADSAYPKVSQFAYYWGARIIEGNAWGGTTPDVFTGYQTPAAWYIMGEPKVAKSIITLLKDAQKEYQKRYGDSGPFMPVYQKDGFGWNGVDPNTDWMGFQYRTFAHLAHYYYLSGDEESKKLLDNFYNWVTANTKEEKGGRISIPIWLRKEGDTKADTYCPAASTGDVCLTGYSPNHHGLFAQGLVFLAAKSGDKKYQLSAQKILDDAVDNRQAKDGSFPDTEPLDGKGRKFTFRQAEMGMALALYDLLL